MPRKLKKPVTSVTVVSTFEDGCAGSCPSTVSTIGIEDPDYFQLRERDDGDTRVVCSDPYPGTEGWARIDNGAVLTRELRATAPEIGFRPLPKRGGVVTNDLVDRLREETGD